MLRLAEKRLNDAKQESRPGSEPFRCVVVDGELMVLQMLCGILRTLSGAEIVATGTSIKEVVVPPGRRKIDLLIIDASRDGGSGFDLVRSFVSSYPSIRCILLSNSPTSIGCPDDLVDHVVTTIDKSSPLSELVAAIEGVGGERLHGGLQIPKIDDVREKLTHREFEVFRLLGRGLSNKEISGVLSIAVQTVETHRKAITKKLFCNGASLIRMATLSQLHELV